MSKRKKQDDAWPILRWLYRLFTAAVLLSLLVVTNFPDPQGSSSHVSMLGRVLSGHVIPLLVVLLPLAITLMLEFWHKLKYVNLAIIGLLIATMFGYFYVVDTIFMEIGVEGQPALEAIATGLQIFFFSIVPFSAVLAGISGYFYSLNKAYSQPHPAWIIKARNILFPRFNEVHYFTFFSCVAIMSLVNPELASEVIDSQPRMIIIGAGVIYILFRILGKRQFGHEAKTWIAFTYYGGVSFLSFMSLMAQLDNKELGGSLWHQANIWITTIVCAAFFIRFMTTAIIVRAANRKYEKLVTERYSDEQYSWLNFAAIIATSLITMSIVSDHYLEAENIILLSFAYTLFVHNLVFLRIPRLIHLLTSMPNFRPSKSTHAPRF